MVNLNKYFLAVFLSAFLIFLVWSLASNEIQFEILNNSSFEGSIIPEQSTKIISLNLLLFSVLIVFLAILSLIFISNLTLGIYVLLFMAPLVRQVEYINIYIGKILPILIIVAYFISGKFRLKAIKFPNEIRLYIVAVITGLTFSAAYNGVSLLPVVRQILFFIIIYIIYGSFIEGKLRYFPQVIIFGALFAAADIVVGSFLSDSFYNFFNQTGLLFNNQTAAGTVLLCALPFLYSSENNIFYRPLLRKLVIAFLLIAALFTGSRGSLLGMVFFIIFLYLDKLSALKVFILIIFSGFLALAICYTPYLQQVLRLDNPLSQRDLLFVLGFGAIVENPFFGVGPGGFSNIAYAYGSDLGILDLMKGGIFGSSSHNVYIDAYLEAGIIGFLALLFLYYSILKNNNTHNYMVFVRSAFIKSYLIISFFGSKVILGGAVTEGLIIWIIIVILPILNGVAKDGMHNPAQTGVDA